MSESLSVNTGAAPVDAEQSHEAIAQLERSAALAALAITREEERSKRDNERKSASAVASSDELDLVKLRLGEKVFEVKKSALLRFQNTYFHGLFSSSGAWQPDADGAYFIDRPAMGFDRILKYLRLGRLSVRGLTQLEEECLYSSLDYFLIPYQRQWKYDNHSMIDRFRAECVRELRDGRLCGSYENDVIVWNMYTNAIEMALKGHTKHISQVIQLHDGRVCSSSYNGIIKLWNLDSRLCELTLYGHTDHVSCLIQLIDGRVCSGSFDKTISVWNISTGVYELTMYNQFAVYAIAQLANGHIYCGDSCGIISIYSLLSGECNLSWRAHINDVTAIVCIDATRICSGSHDGSIKVWSTATRECERTLVGHTFKVFSLVQMQDGELCSASRDGTLILWNPDTGKCEKTLGNKTSMCSFQNVTQLSDGRLVSCSSDCTVYIWS